jgi:hypothetical protein
MKRAQDLAQDNLVRMSAPKLQDDVAVEAPLAQLRPSLRMTLLEQADAELQSKLDAYFARCDYEAEDTLP